MQIAGYQALYRQIVMFAMYCCQGTDPEQRTFSFARNRDNVLAKTPWENCQYAKDLMNEVFEEWEECFDHFLKKVGNITGITIGNFPSIHHIDFVYTEEHRKKPNIVIYYNDEKTPEDQCYSFYDELKTWNMNIEMNFSMEPPKVYDMFLKRQIGRSKNSKTVMNVIGSLQQDAWNNFTTECKYKVERPIRISSITANLTITNETPISVKNFVNGWVYYGLLGFEQLKTVLDKDIKFDFVKFNLVPQFANLEVDFGYYTPAGLLETMTITMRPDELAFVFAPEVVV